MEFFGTNRIILRNYREKLGVSVLVMSNEIWPLLQFESQFLSYLTKNTSKTRKTNISTFAFKSIEQYKQPMIWFHSNNTRNYSHNTKTPTYRRTVSGEDTRRNLWNVNSLTTEPKSYEPRNVIRYVQKSISCRVVPRDLVQWAIVT